MSRKNPLGLAVLALLAERPMHPYEMAVTLRQRAKEASIKLNYGSLYTVIGSLEREGHIHARERTREGTRPERSVYELTQFGEVELHEWMYDLLARPVKEYPQFEAALSLMPVLQPDEVATLLAERIARIDREIEKVGHILGSVAVRALPRLFTIETEYYVAMLEAEREWVVKLVQLINKSDGKFTSEWRALHTRQYKAAPATKRGRSTKEVERKESAAMNSATKARRSSTAAGNEKPPEPRARTRKR